MLAISVRTLPAYKYHFGGLNEAYKLIGYPLIRDHSYRHAGRLSKALRSAICDEICDGVRQISGYAEKIPGAGMLRLNGTVTIKVAIRKAWMRYGGIVWTLPIPKHPTADILIIGRLKPPEESVFDYFIIPAFSQLRGGLRAPIGQSVPYLELYHFTTLAPLIEPFRRCCVHRTA